MSRLSIRRTPSIALLCMVAAGLPLSAQQPAPPACTAVEHRQFDFWTGEWIVTNARGDTIGTNHIKVISAGCALLEQWQGRLSGVLEDAAMVLSGGARVTPKGTVMDRISWTPAADGSVEQVWQISTDDGATWQPAFRGIYRKARTAG